MNRMSVSPQILEALSIIYTRLSGAAALWAIDGSLGMVMQGMDLDVHDIDLQSDADGAYVIQACLAEFMIRPVVLREAARFCSHFGAAEIAGVGVEIMGDIQVRPDNGPWHPAPDMLALIRWVDYNGMRLPVLDLEHEYQAYLTVGRVEKAQKIRDFLDSNK